MTLVIKSNDKKQYKQVLDLVKSLNLEYDELDEDEKNFYNLAGSFDLPESADELISIIKEGKSSKNTDISWTNI